MLKEEIYYKPFSDKNLIPDKDIILIYRIYFQYCKKEINSFESDTEFWEKACLHFSQNSCNVGKNIEIDLLSIDFSLESLLSVVLIIKNDTAKISPVVYAKKCTTTGMLVFIIKDVLEYSGVFFEKKLNIQSAYKLSNYVIEYLQTTEKAIEDSNIY